MMDVTDRMGIVGRKLRVNVRTFRKQETGTGQVGDVGIAFQGKHRVVRQPLFLGPFDLHVPVGALYQAHGDDAPVFTGQPVETFQQAQRAFLVSLHRKAEPRPAAQAGMTI